MQNVKRKIDFTNGRVFLKIVWFILPIVATNLLQMFYNAADMMVVSLSSEQNAVGAIGTTNAFIHLIVNFFIGFAVGANVVVAREIGAGDKQLAICRVIPAVREPYDELFLLRREHKPLSEIREPERRAGGGPGDRFGYHRASLPYRQYHECAN